MSKNLFRIEKKIPVTSFETGFFLNKLKENNFIKTFDDRIVNSIYFENKYLSIFANSEEGILPRKKVRLRNYPNSDNDKFYLEKKISSIEGRYKETNEISIEKYKEYTENSIIDNIYGIIRPKIIVKYTRSYYENNYLRVTFDRNIFYKEFNKNVCLNDHFNVFEIKSKNILYFNTQFIDEFKIKRFSKYCNGIRRLNIS